MKVAVIGGTGFVGSYIAESLVRDGHDVSMLVRPGSEAKVPSGIPVTTTSGDIASQDALNAVLAGCDAVIYCVGILRAYPRQGITFESTQYEGVVRVVEAAIANDVGRFVLMSANGVRLQGTRYQETKRRAEEVVLGSGLAATVLRPSVIFGDPRGRMEFATQLNRDMVQPPLPAIGFFSGWRPATGPVMMSPVHVADVASAFSSVLTNEASVGATYVIAGPEDLSWVQMLRIIAAASGRKKWIIPFPISLMTLAATLLDWLPFFPVTRDQLTMLAENNVGDPTILESLIGRQPRAFSPGNLAYLSN